MMRHSTLLPHPRIAWMMRHLLEFVCCSLMVLAGRNAPTLVIYEIFVQSFQDSDGDGVGDFNGLTSRLDYLSDELGITALWLLPIHPAFSERDEWMGDYNPGLQNPHGYDVIDHYAVRESYGGMEAFDRFLEAAHSRGIRIFLDMVPNHVGRMHHWFLASEDKGHPDHLKFRDYFVWRPSKPWGCCFHWSERRQEYYLGLFTWEMPDLNYDNENILQDVQKVLKFWIDKGVDGFRFDAVSHTHDIVPGLLPMSWSIDNPKAFEIMNRLNTFVRNYQSNKATASSGDPFHFAVCEANSPGKHDYVTKGRCTAIFDWCLSEALGFVCSEDLPHFLVGESGRGPGFPEGGNVKKCTQIADPSMRYASGQIKACVRQWQARGWSPKNSAIFLTNHDMDRIGRTLRTPERRALAARMLMTFPGIPFMYYGEEAGLSSGHLNDSAARRPMPWTPKPPKYGFMPAAAAKEGPWLEPYFEKVDGSLQILSVETSKDLVKAYANAIRIRKEYAGYFEEAPQWARSVSHESLLAYVLRGGPAQAQRVLVVHNTARIAHSQARLSLPIALPDAAAGRGAAVNEVWEDRMEFGKKVPVQWMQAANEQMVLTLDHLAPYQSHFFSLPAAQEEKASNAEL